MRVHGNLNFNDNQIQNFIIDPVSSFPTPKLGRMVYRTDIGNAYICISEDNSGVWVAAGNRPAYVHTQSSASLTWTVEHNLGTTDLIVQTYDSTGAMFIPDSIIATSANQVVVTVSESITGKVVINSIATETA